MLVGAWGKVRLVPAVVMMTDLVGSTKYAFREHRRHDPAYFDLVDSFEALVRDELDSLVNYHYDLVENFDYLIQIDRGDEANIFFWPKPGWEERYNQVSVFGHPLWELLNTAQTISQRWLISEFNLARIAKGMRPIVFGTSLHTGRIRVKARPYLGDRERLDGTDLILSRNLLELAKSQGRHTRILLSKEAYLVTERHHYGGYMFRESFFFDQLCGPTKSFPKLEGRELIFKLRYLDFRVFQLRITEARFKKLFDLYLTLEVPPEYFSLLARVAMTFLTVVSNQEFYDNQFLRMQGIPFPVWTRRYDWAEVLEKLARRRLEKAPDSIFAHFALGHALFKQGDREGARRHFLRVEELYPGVSAVAKYLALLEEDPEERVRIYERILPGHAFSAVRLAECAVHCFDAYRKTGKEAYLERARRLAIRADELYPYIIREKVGRIFVDLVKELGIPHHQKIDPLYLRGA